MRTHFVDLKCNNNINRELLLVSTDLLFEFCFFVWVPVRWKQCLAMSVGSLRMDRSVGFRV